jgi:hypothetical protein
VEYRQCSRCGQFRTKLTRIKLGGTVLGDSFNLCGICYDYFETAFLAFLQDTRKYSKKEAKEILKQDLNSE